MVAEIRIALKVIDQVTVSGLWYDKAAARSRRNLTCASEAVNEQGIQRDFARLALAHGTQTTAKILQTFRIVTRRVFAHSLQRAIIADEFNDLNPTRADTRGSP